jgi:hypothetical protein
MTVPAASDLSAVATRADVDRLQRELAQLPQYEPVTKHYFHGGMYCREVWRAADVLVVGAVHRKEHFYVIVSGTALISGDGGPAQRVTGPTVMLSMPGTKRAVYAETDVLCMTFHRTDATTVEAAEAELVEPDASSQYGPGNRLLQLKEVTP